jgi:hypothetical protein
LGKLSKITFSMVYRGVSMRPVICAFNGPE